MFLLPTGSGERAVLEVGGNPAAILPSCQYVQILQIYEFSWVVKIRHTSEAVLRTQYTPWQLY